MRDVGACKEKFKNHPGPGGLAGAAQRAIKKSKDVATCPGTLILREKVLQFFREELHVELNLTEAQLQKLDALLTGG